MIKNDLIQLISLSKKFGKTKALDNVSFSIPENSVLGLLGPNGSGKSTLMRIIAGLIRNWDGDLIFQKESIKKKHDHFLGQCGFLIENPTFYQNLTAHQNLSILSRISNCESYKINEVLLDVDLIDAAHKKISDFSYGMKQRLGIAQAILHDPDILFLDEPNNGLDPLGIREMNKTISNLHNKGKTIVISTHILHDVEELCSNIVILKEGRVLLNNSMDELIEKSKTITIKTKNIELLHEYLKPEVRCKIIKSHRDQITIQTDLDVCSFSKLLPNDINIKSIIKEPDLSEFFKL